MSNEDADNAIPTEPTEPTEEQISRELEKINSIIKNTVGSSVSPDTTTQRMVDFTIPEKQCVVVQQHEGNATLAHVNDETSEVNISFSEFISSNKYRENIRARVESAIAGIDSNVEKLAKDVVSEHIEMIVMHALGFRSSWGSTKSKWEIDSGRNTLVSNRLSMLAQNRAQAMVDIFIENDRHLFLSTKLNDKLKKQMNEMLDRQIDYKVMTILRARIDEIASERAEHIIKMAFDEKKG